MVKDPITIDQQDELTALQKKLGWSDDRMLEEANIYVLDDGVDELNELSEGEAKSLISGLKQEVLDEEDDEDEGLDDEEEEDED